MLTLSGDVRPGDIVRIRGERWRVAQRVPHGAATLVETDGCDAGNRGVHSSFLLPFEPVEAVNVSRIPRVVRPLRWRRVARRALGDATPGWTSLRAATRAHMDLMPFQLEPALALLHGDGCRFLIADAVGLGKTVQAGLMIAELRQRDPEARTIVVCPAGVREQWREELLRFDLRAEVFDAAGIARAAAALPSGFNPWAIHPLVIASVDYLKRPEVIRSLETLLWDIVILDEAHALAGHSDRATAASALAGRARFVVMLTATPHSGDAEAFRRMCDIGRLEADADRLLFFSRTRADVGMHVVRRTRLLRVTPTPAEQRMHDALRTYASRVWQDASGATAPAARLAMAVLARRASSSAASLSRSLERRLTLLTSEREFPPVRQQPGLPFAPPEGDDDCPDALLATRGLRDTDEEVDVLGTVLALARDASAEESKLRALHRLVQRANEPAIVFTEYRDTLEQIAKALGAVPFVQLHGGLTPRERAASLRTFTTGAARVLIATDAASEGLNLHHRCRLVVNLELPWMPLRLEQRAGRVDRIGQQRRVHAVHLVARGTGEESILAKLAVRIRTVRGAVGPGALPSFPGVADVGSALFGETELAELATSSPDSPVRHLTRVGNGRDETTRIRTARTLLAGAAAEPSAARPLATWVPVRRHAHHTGSSIWVFRIVAIDRRGRVVAEELWPLRCCRRERYTVRTPSEFRQLLAEDAEALVTATRAQRDRRIASLVSEIEVPAAIWLHREHAIAASLRAAHARLSARLVQLGLFDRRNDKAASAQSALLDDALLKSSARIDHLKHLCCLTAEPADLGLVIAFE